jgi:LEA14-like dessication related protein
MKKILPYLSVAAIGYGIYFWLMNKKKAGTNLKFVPVDIGIDTNKIKRAFFTKIFFNIKLMLTNDEAASVNVNSIELVISVNGKVLGYINNQDGFVVDARNSKTINLETSISSLGLIGFIKDLIKDGFKFPVNVKGFINTDLGKIDINYTQTSY